MGMQARAQRSGLESSLITIQGGGHHLTHQLRQKPYSEALMTFLRKAMSLAELPCPQRESFALADRPRLLTSRSRPSGDLDSNDKASIRELTGHSRRTDNSDWMWV